MDNKFNQFSSNGSEGPTSKKELGEKLAEAEKKLEEMQARASEFYDVELYDLYNDTILKRGTDNIDALKKYFESLGGDYEKIVENYDKENDFRVNNIKPIMSEIRAIKKSIHANN